MNRYVLYSKLPLDGKRVTSAELCTMLDCSGSEIRAAVNVLRREGKPICADDKGYYIAQTVRDLTASYSRLTVAHRKYSKPRAG